MTEYVHYTETAMDRVARWITEHSRLIVAFFAAAAIVCAVLFFGVKVNYDMTAYLPADAESTVALQIMQEEFSASVPNARVMVHGYDQLTAQQFTVLGVLLRFGVHQALAQQQVDSDAFPSLRHTLYIHTGGKADTVVVGQGEQEAGVEQTTVAVEWAHHGIFRINEPCALQVAGAADIVVLSGHGVQAEAVELVGHSRYDGPDVILRHLISG